MSKIFISHSLADQVFSRILAEDLKKNGHQPWLDEWNIKVGDCILTEIESGISDSDYIVIVLSKNSVNSGWVDREWKTKYWHEINKQKKYLLPVLIENCEIPELLKTKKYADFREGYPKAFNELLSSINSEMPITEKKGFLQNNSNLSELTDIFISLSRDLYEPSEEEYEKFSLLREELYENIMGLFDRKIDRIPILMKLQSNRLFQKIVSNDSLKKLDFIDIQHIRNLPKERWYNKFNIVSALSISLINDFDPVKVNLLIDFLIDGENGVWQMALIGLVLGLYDYDKIIDDYPEIKNKILKLREIKIVSEGIERINFNMLFRKFELTKIDSITAKLLKNQESYYWFLPANLNNDLIQAIIKNTKLNFSSKTFSNLLEKSISFNNLQKYNLYFSLPQLSQKQVDSIIEILDSENEFLKEYIISNNKFFENRLFDTYLEEMFNYYLYNKEKNKNNILLRKLEFHESQLIQYLLDNNYYLKIKGYSYLQLGDLDKSITYLEKINTEKSVIPHIIMCYIIKFDLKKLSNFCSIVLSNDPVCLEAIFGLIIAYVAQGNIEKICELIPNLKQAISYPIDKKKQGNDILSLAIEQLELFCSQLPGEPNHLEDYINDEIVEKIEQIEQLTEENFISSGTFAFPSMVTNLLKLIKPTIITDQYSTGSKEQNILNKMTGMILEKFPEYSLNIPYIASELGLLYFQLGKLDKAIECYHKLIQSGEIDKYDKINIGHIKLCSKEYEDAINCYENGVICWNNFDDFCEDFINDYKYIMSFGIHKKIFQKISSYLEEIHDAYTSQKQLDNIQSKKQTLVNLLNEEVGVKPRGVES